MTIKQFNGNYLAQEDRVLFRFNTQNQEEYRFWLTRRVTLFILAATAHLLTKKLETTYSPDAAKALNEFGKQVILGAEKAENLQATVYESGLNFPIGFDPLLVIDVSCSLTKNGEKLFQLQDVNKGDIDDAVSMDFVLPGSANINLKLSGNTLQAMCVLLDQIRQQAGWGEAVLQGKNTLSEEQNLEPKITKNISIH